jgi:alpha-1,2-mannosyltransferase
MTTRGRFDNLRMATLWTVLALLVVHLANAVKRNARGRRATRRRLMSDRHRWAREGRSEGGRGGKRGGGTTRELEPRRTVGFYHPASADGGGGERVLYEAIAATQRRRAAVRGSVGGTAANGDEGGDEGDDERGMDDDEDDCMIVVYTASNGRGRRDVDSLARGRELIARAESRFGVKLREPIHALDLKSERFARAETYPRCTVIGQFIGGAVLAFEALWKFTPDVFVDTVGHAAAYPAARYLFGCQTVAYVHYPTVSSDMIARVQSRVRMYNNADRFAASRFLTAVKVLYYRAFAALYGWCGKACACVMVNSSWTKGHIDKLWGVDSTIVYPPCNVEDLSRIPLTRPRLDKAGNAVKKDKSSLRVVSVGQFRPEKAHVVQLAAWKALKKLSPKFPKIENAILVFVGGCRDNADRERLEDLQQSVKDLEIENSVEFHVDVPYEEVRRQLSRASIGLHTMLDEHFGICVVEYMAAGAVPIAHASGGPFLDIIRDEADGITGFTADNVPAFAEALEHVLLMQRPDREDIAQRARRRSKMFTAEKFRDAFVDALAKCEVKC